MGCCYCQPITEVTENPEVSFYADVGYCALIHNRSRKVERINVAESRGLLYVKGDRLHYNMIIGTMEMSNDAMVGTRLGCSCGGSSWRLSKITNIETVNGNISLTCSHPPINRIVVLRPGLKLTFRNNKTFVAAMPSAVNFSTKLRQHLASSQEGPSAINRAFDSIFTDMCTPPNRPRGQVSASQHSSAQLSKPSTNQFAQASASPDTKRIYLATACSTNQTSLRATATPSITFSHSTTASVAPANTILPGSVIYPNRVVRLTPDGPDCPLIISPAGITPQGPGGIKLMALTPTGPKVLASSRGV